MRRILGSITPRGVLATAMFALLIVLLSKVSARQSVDLAARPWSVEKCLEVLRDDDPLMRSYAIDDLLLDPRSAVKFVAANAHSSDEPMAMACVDVLAEFVLVDDPDVQAAAIDALIDLRSQANSTSSIAARKWLLANQGRVGACCTDALQSSGAVVHLFADVSGVSEVLMPGAVLLGPEWNGGEEAVRWMCRIPRSPRVYLVDGHELNEAELELIRTERPDIRVRRRGRACLGLMFRESLRIDSIVPGSPAEAAGIPSSSRLVQFDGVTVTDFEDLLDVMVDRQPGETVHLTVARRGEFSIYPLQLGSDLATGQCQCEGAPIAASDDRDPAI